jgi:hypothetical protein
VPSRRSPRRRLLIIDCDAGQLEAQGIALGRQLARNRLPLYDFEVTYIAVHDAATLQQQLSSLGRRRFHAVVAVGHANTSGIRAARDLFLSWTEFAHRLAKLRPEKLLLIACQAGGIGVAQEMFDTLKTLRRVYACPLNLPSSQAAIVMQTTPLILSAVDLTEGIRIVLQGLLLLAKDGLFFEHRREEFQNQDSIEDAIGRSMLGVFSYVAFRRNRDRRPTTFA